MTDPYGMENLIKTRTTFVALGDPFPDLNMDRQNTLAAHCPPNVTVRWTLDNFPRSWAQTRRDYFLQFSFLFTEITVRTLSVGPIRLLGNANKIYRAHCECK